MLIGMRYFREHRKFTEIIHTEIVGANYNLRTVRQNTGTGAYLYNLYIQVFATFSF